jgi:uncharacterized membrane protein YfcA
MTSYFFVLSVGLVAGCVSGVIGTGSSLMLLPVLVYAYGPKQAVPIIAVAAVLANIARVAAWWREVDWKAAAAYALPGALTAALGARTMLSLRPAVIDAMLGLFFLAMLVLRRWRAGTGRRLRLREVSAAGAVIGFLTGLVLSTGPLSVPVFTAYGLTGGAFISTEAASALALYLSKVATFRQLGALSTDTLLQGAIVGSSLMAGTYVGKAFVARISPHAFSLLLDGLMLCSGLSLLWAAIR